MGDAAWNELVEKCLMTHCSGGSVLDMRDGRVWGSSPDFGPRTYTSAITKEDGAEVDERVNEADVMTSFGKGSRHAHGLRMNQTKYMIVRQTPEVVYGKCPRGGCCLATGAQTVVFGAFDENAGQTAGDANAAVEKLASYLRSVGY